MKSSVFRSTHLCCRVLIIMAACLCALSTQSRAAGPAAPRGGYEHTAFTARAIGKPAYLNWKYKPQDRSGKEGRATIPPIVIGSTMFTGDTGLYRIDLDRFETVWSFEGNDDWYAGVSPPTVDKGVVYCTSGDGCAYALAADSGKLLWKFTGTRAAAWNPPILAGDLLVFGSDCLYALDPQSGKCAWRQPQVATVVSSPACDGERIFCGCADGKLVAVDLESGEIVWDHQSTRQADVAPIVSGGRVFFGADSVYALDAETGEVIWRSALADVPTGWMACDSKRVFVGARDNKLYALDTADGEPLWEFDAGSPISASPVVIGDLVWIGTDANKLWGLQAQSGKKKVEIGTDSKPLGWVVAANGVLYVPCEDGAIHCYSATMNEFGIDFGEAKVTEVAETGGKIKVEIEVTNRGTATWPAGEYSLAAELKDSAAKIRFSDPRLLRLTEDLAPGQQAKLSGTIDAPDEQGDYTLEIDLARKGESVRFPPGHQVFNRRVAVRHSDRRNPAPETQYLRLGYFEYEQAVKDVGSVKVALVLVEDKIFSEIEDEIAQYVEDVRRALGFKLIVERATFGSAPELRAYLRDYCSKTPIQGVVLVGLHPYPMWEMKSGERGTVPLYYCDLDGEFEDTDGDGYFEKHTWGRYPYPQIWVSWIRSPRDRVQDYRRFFNKCHAHYEGKLGIPQRALAYVSHDWWMSSSDLGLILSRLFGAENVTTVGSMQIKTQGEEYLRYLDEPYTVIDTWAHSGSTAHWPDLGPHTPVKAADILKTRGGGLIGLFWACHFGDIDEPRDEYSSPIAYLMGEGIGQAVIGVTRSIGTQYHELIYRGLAEGLPLSTAYLAYLREIYADPEYQHAWNNDPVENFVFDLILFGNPFVAIAPRRTALKDSEGTGTVRGKVVDSFWDKPIAGAVVTAGGATETKTDEDGFFSLQLAPGSYTIRASAAGFVARDQQVEITGSPGRGLYFDLRSEFETPLPKGVSIVSLPANPDLVKESFENERSDGILAVNSRLKLAEKESAFLLGAQKADMMLWEGGGFKRAIGNDAGAFIPGRGYVICSKDATRLATRGLKSSPRWPYEVALNKGWNLIGNPFDRPIPINSVRVKWVIWGMKPEETDMADAAQRGWIQPELWELTPMGYSPAAEFEPWKGYWIWAETASQDAYGHPELLIGPPGRENSQPDRPDAAPPTFPERLESGLDWYVQIGGCVSPEDGAESSIPPDLCNVFGVSKNADDKHDLFDACEPPPLDISFTMEKLPTKCEKKADQELLEREEKLKKMRSKYETSRNPYISLAFANSDWAGDSGFYAFDVKQADGSPKSWLMVLRYDGEERRIKLKWQTVHFPADEYDLKMTDLENETEIDILTQDAYTFFTEPAKKARSFRITAVPKGSSERADVHPTGITGS
jgi:outer membrane protein assembly factor BamB